MANPDDSSRRSRLPADPWLRRIMALGIPLAVVSIALLWGAYFTGTPWMAQSFIGLGAMALAAGVAYNTRLVFVMLRERRKQQGDSHG